MSLLERARGAFGSLFGKEQKNEQKSDAHVENSNENPASRVVEQAREGRTSVDQEAEESVVARVEARDVSVELSNRGEVADVAVDVLAENPQVLQEIGAQGGPEAQAHLALVQQEVKTPEGKSKWKQFFDDQLESRGGLMTAAATFMGGVGLRRAMTALKLSGPYGWIAAVAGMGAVEGGRKLYEQLYKRRDANEILVKMREEMAKPADQKDLSRIAALAAKADQLHRNALLNGENSDVEEVANLVKDSRTFLTTEINRADYANASEKDTVLKLLEDRKSSGADVMYSKSKSANELIRQVNREFTSRGKWSDVNKAIVMKSILRGMAIAGAGVLFSSLLHEGVAYAKGTETAKNIIADRAQNAAEKIKTFKEQMKLDLGAMIKAGKPLSATIGQGDGYDRAARSMIHDALANQMSIDGKTAVSTEKLLIMERHLSDALQDAYKAPGALEAKILHPKDVVQFGYDKVQAIIDADMKVGPDKEAYMHAWLEKSGHHLSEKHLVALHDFDSFANYESNSLGVAEVVKTLQEQAATETRAELQNQAQEHWDSAWVAVGGFVALAGAGAGAVAVERGQERQRAAAASSVQSRRGAGRVTQSARVSNTAPSSAAAPTLRFNEGLNDTAEFTYPAVEEAEQQPNVGPEQGKQNKEKLFEAFRQFNVAKDSAMEKLNLAGIDTQQAEAVMGKDSAEQTKFYEKMAEYFKALLDLKDDQKTLMEGAQITFGQNDDERWYLNALEDETGMATKFFPKGDLLLDPAHLDAETMVRATKYFLHAKRLNTIAKDLLEENKRRSADTEPDLPEQLKKHERATAVVRSTKRGFEDGRATDQLGGASRTGVFEKSSSTGDLPEAEQGELPDTIPLSVESAVKNNTTEMEGVALEKIQLAQARADLEAAQSALEEQGIKVGIAPVFKLKLNPEEKINVYEKVELYIHYLEALSLPQKELLKTVPRLQFGPTENSKRYATVLENPDLSTYFEPKGLFLDPRKFSLEELIRITDYYMRAKKAYDAPLPETVPLEKKQEVSAENRSTVKSAKSKAPKPTSRLRTTTKFDTEEETSMAEAAERQREKAVALLLKKSLEAWNKEKIAKWRDEDTSELFELSQDDEDRLNPDLKNFVEWQRDNQNLDKLIRILDGKKKLNRVQEQQLAGIQERINGYLKS